MIRSKLVKKILTARENVAKEISAFAKGPGIYAGGLANEGYNGGYLNALDDILSIVNDCHPCKAREFWGFLNQNETNTNCKFWKNHEVPGRGICKKYKNQIVKSMDCQSCPDKRNS